MDEFSDSILDVFTTELIIELSLSNVLTATSYACLWQIKLTDLIVFLLLLLPLPKFMMLYIFQKLLNFIARMLL